MVLYSVDSKKSLDNIRNKVTKRLKKRKSEGIEINLFFSGWLKSMIMSPQFQNC